MSVKVTPASHKPALVAHVNASYGPSLEAALERAVAPFGGWSAIVKPGERIAVKVNLLRGAAPEKVVTTNPQTLRAVLRALRATGAEPFVADSPGGPGTRALVMRAYKQSGILAVCEEEGVEAVHADAESIELSAPAGKLFRSFTVCKCFAEADGIVQVGPLKTHGLMRLTGGVKLTFGCIPGLLKAQMHVKAKQRRDFADMLIDLHEAIAPRFTIIDAIVAMEGKGPGNGTPRPMGSLFAARNAHALDAALADRTAHQYRHIYTLVAAAERGLIDLDKPYELAGNPFTPDTGFVPSTQDFDSTADGLTSSLPGFAHRLVRDLVTAKPRLVNEAACTRCGNCAEICGAHAITLAPTPVYDYEACVRCYACTEICPTAAISEVAPLPARLLHLLRARSARA